MSVRDRIKYHKNVTKPLRLDYGNNIIRRNTEKLIPESDVLVVINEAMEQLKQKAFDNKGKILPRILLSDVKEILIGKEKKCIECGAEAEVSSEGSLYCRSCAMKYAK